MPIYEYKCSACGKSFEFFQKMSDPPKTECPECKSNTLQKQIAPANFKINGYCFKNDKK